MNIPGFTPANLPRPHSLITSIDGPKGSGKTSLALTAPGPIAIINIDDSLDGPIQKSGRDDVVKFDVDRPTLVTEMDQDVVKACFDPVVDALFERAFAAVTAGVRTLIVDTMTEVYEMVRLAQYGKLKQVMPIHYSQVNDILRDKLDALRKLAKGKTHLIFIHQSRNAYERKMVNGEMVDEQVYRPNGTPKTELSGWSKIGGYHDIELSLAATPPVVDGQKRLRGARIFAEVMKCRPDIGFLGETYTIAQWARDGKLESSLTLPEFWQMVNGDHDWSV